MKEVVKAKNKTTRLCKFFSLSFSFTRKTAFARYTANPKCTAMKILKNIAFI